MRFSVLSLLVFLSFLLYSCDPDKKDIFNTEHANISATIETNSENIQLGDTLKIKLKIPDTLITGSSTQIVHSLQRAQFGMTIYKMDTANKRGISIRPPFIWMSKGSMEGNLSYVCNTDQKPFETIINCIPQEKGLYYIEIINQAGQFKINNNYEARLLVNFNTPNKHLNILSIITPYFGGQSFYDGVIQKETEGFGVYFFRVL